MIVHPRNPSLWTLLFSIRGSIIPVIWHKVLLVVLFSAVVVALHGRLYEYRMTLTATPFTLWGLTLAIFLAFRNTVAYQRFWEARQLWGELVVVSRNLARQSRTLLPGLAPQARVAIGERLVAYSHALKDGLRGERPGAAALHPLDSEERAVLESSHNPADVLLGLLGRRLLDAARESAAGEVVQVELDRQLTRLAYVQAGCERIKGTPIPYPYLLMLNRVVHIYCVLLPFCLVDSLGWFTPFAVSVLAYTFFGLDALGNQIADPFDTEPHDLPLDAICRTVEISVRELLDEPAPVPLQPVGGVLL